MVGLYWFFRAFFTKRIISLAIIYTIERYILLIYSINFVVSAGKGTFYIKGGGSIENNSYLFFEQI